MSLRERVEDKVNVLVVGAGMYVCGKNTSGYGTVLPSLFQGCKDGLISSFKVASTSKESAIQASEKFSELVKLFGFSPKAEFYPQAADFNEKAYEEALEQLPPPRCAIVAVPDHLHYQITVDLLHRNLHVLVVKPLTPSVAEALELIRLAQEKKLFGCVEFHKRFDESSLKLGHFIHEGRLGSLLQFIVEYSQRKSIPTTNFRKWVNKTDIFQYLGVHYVDLIYFFTQALPTRVMSLGQKKFLVKEGIDTWDAIQTIIEWRDLRKGDSFLSTHFTSWIDPNSTTAMSDQKITAIGTSGRCVCDQKNRGVQLVTDKDGVEDVNPYFSQFFSSSKDGSLYFSGYGPKSILAFMKDVLELEGGRKRLEDIDRDKSRPTFKQALISTAVIEAHHKSLQAGGSWTVIDENVFENLKKVAM
jgi:predicted dehydrogenase